MKIVGGLGDPKDPLEHKLAVYIFVL
ncbi:hypothetical protein TRIP_E90046 [uncultured Spirochaetota bacterium]|nr:hypothetical protein TRIP_E90046 [uncultured Spirochaetota bacterium]